MRCKHECWMKTTSLGRARTERTCSTDAAELCSAKSHTAASFKGWHPTILHVAANSRSLNEHTAFVCAQDYDAADKQLLTDMLAHPPASQCLVSATGGVNPSCKVFCRLSVYIAI